MSVKSRKAARDRAKGKRWVEASEAADKLDADQQRLLIRRLVAHRWQAFTPKNLAQAQLKKRVAERAAKLMDILSRDLVELEAQLAVNGDKYFDKHFKAATRANARRGKWSMEALRRLASDPRHVTFVEEGHKLWSGHDLEDGWKLGADPRV